MACTTLLTDSLKDLSDFAIIIHVKLAMRRARTNVSVFCMLQFLLLKYSNNNDNNNFIVTKINSLKDYLNVIQIAFFEKMSLVRPC